MKKHLKKILGVLCALLLLAGCTSYPNAVLPLCDLSSKETLDTIPFSSDTMQVADSAALPLSMRAEKKVTKHVLTDYLSMHLGYGGLKISHSDGGNSSERMTFYMDYEHYFKKCPGLNLGIFYALYGESDSEGLYDQLFIYSFGPRLGYKIRVGPLAVGAGFGFGGALMSIRQDTSRGWNTESTLGSVYTGNLGVEVLFKNNFALSMKYQYMKQSFSDKYFIKGDGKLKATYNSFLIGGGFYF